MGINLRKEAKGRECQIRVPGVCNGNPDTTVLAHLSGGGMGRKQDNFTGGSWACCACHDAVDGRIKTSFTKAELRLWHLEAVLRTQEMLVAEGVITLD
jgi:hypothetical protein